LADCLTIGVFYGNSDPAIAIPEVRALLERALAMDPRFAETHTSLGFLDVVLLDFAAAEQHFLLSHRAKPDQALTVVVECHARLGGGPSRRGNRHGPSRWSARADDPDVPRRRGC
jgi:hypothetical protein